MRVNLGAVFLAGVLDWLLGGVWFTVFAHQWRAGLRMSPEEIQSYSAHPNFWTYLIALLCSFLMAYAIARLLAGSVTHSLFRGLLVGILVGFAAGLAMVTELVFEIRSHLFILIAAAYPLAGCILMGIVLGAWKPKNRANLSGKASL